MDLEVFKSKIHYYRSLAGISQKKLAQELGLSPGVLSNKLNGTNKASLNIPEIKRIIEHLVEWGSISSQEELIELLELANLRPSSFSPAQWDSLAFQQLKPLPPESSVPKDKPGPSVTATYRHNLPLELTRFVGRDRQIAEIKEWVEHSLIEKNSLRLITLLGSGGIGKTRLSLKLAAELVPHFKDGIWFIELAAVTNPALITQTIALELGIGEGIERSFDEALSRYLHSRQTLVVLDSCEHLIESCAWLVEKLLQTCPNLFIMTTSREALQIGPETVWRIPPLTLPHDDEVGLPQALEKYEAIQLFVERARAVQPGFRLTFQNAHMVNQVCKCLDGIPLALELAAARLSAISLEQIASRLDDRFRLLNGGNRTARPRHQTLRSTIDWSYELLSEIEKRLFERLSVFRGGWTLEAAERICAGYALEQEQILNTLIQLVNKSLVTVKTSHEEGDYLATGESRYWLLDTIRQYAQEKLVESGQTAWLEEQHLDFFGELAQTAEAKLRGSEQLVWLGRLEKEQDNLRAALEFSIRNDNAIRLKKGLRLAGNLFYFWKIRSRLMEGFNLLELILEHTATWPSSPELAKVMCAAGVLAIPQHNHTGAGEWLSRSLANYRILGDKRGEGWVLYYLGMSATLQANHQLALELTCQSLDLMREAGERWELANLQVSLGIISLQIGDYPAARTCLKEAIASFREQGDRSSLAYALNVFGDISRAEGDYSGAELYYKESGYLYEICHDEGRQAFVKANMGYVAKQRGDYRLAKELFEQGLSYWIQYHNSRFAISPIFGLAGIALAQGQLELAARLFGAGATEREKRGVVFSRPDQYEYERDLADLAIQLDEISLAKALAEGRQIGLEQILALSEMI
jgi:predicted ATPase/transcriptional regulator with XRE-family HTH domain